MEQLEPDFRDIERQHDAPPDQPPYDWADPDLWNANDEEDEDA